MKKKFEYKWVIAISCFLMIFTVLGFCSSGRGLYIAAVTEALGISRSAFSVNDSLRFITTAIVNLFFGSLILRFGARKLIAAGFICLTVACILYAVGTNVFVFYIGGIFLGIGFSWTGTTMIGAIIGRWFKENRGTVMGAILAANGVGAALSIQIVSPIIYQEGNKFGYQDSYKLVALILVVVGIIVVSLIRNNPKEDNLSVPQLGKKKPKGNVWPGKSFDEILKKKYFYADLFCVFVIGMVLQGISGVAAPLLRDVGLKESYVALVLSAHSIALTVFKFGVGFSYDRFGIRTTSNICCITAIFIMIILTQITNSYVGMVLAMLYGIFSSLALPLETIMLPIFAGELFGEKSYDKVLGIICSVNTAGYAVGIPLANLCYDIFGTYNIALYISAGLMLLATIIKQFVITESKKERLSLEG